MPLASNWLHISTRTHRIYVTLFIRSPTCLSIPFGALSRDTFFHQDQHTAFLSSEISTLPSSPRMQR